MLKDKEIKKQFRPIFAQDPDKYYATEILKRNGFRRSICTKCSKPFWSVVADRTTCDDPACSGGFRFFGNTPAKNSMDYIQTWKTFEKMFQKMGYTSIARYPVVARWRDDMDFVIASITDFQPFVVSGEVKPPANPLVIPQFCMRFNDIDNVGITGAHYTGFVMIGQHAFVPPEQWDQKKYFSDIYTWLTEGLGLPKEEITFHEDVWAGGGNFGPCMEYFSRGLELGNQVYMTNEVTPTGIKELKIKVLDMGMGHERNAWFSQGTSTSYETTFPTVVKKLYERTGVKVNHEVMNKFLPYSSYLNVDETDDINKVWADIAHKMHMEPQELKDTVLPLAAIYSIADHTRSLLFAISDGGLPSNVGGSYNLRVILRRALTLIDQFGWKIDLIEVAKWHAEYLRPLFPELEQNLDIVTKVLNVEKQKYDQTKEKTKSIVTSLLNKGEISEEKLLEVYDSNGISPELVREEAKKLGQKVHVPDDFYMKVAARHETVEKNSDYKDNQNATLQIDNLPPSKGTYYGEFREFEFDAKITAVHENILVFEETKFYPTSGGQDHDIGLVTHHGVDYNVVNVIKQGASILHVLEKGGPFKVGEIVHCKIDKERRLQLTFHHSSTHIINAAARKILGNHINQAGAKKTTEKAHIDVTHFQNITPEEQKAIEDEANRIVAMAVPVEKSFLSRDEAEKRFGVGIYQGGVVPGKQLRIVDIKGIDVEACGGTHINNTKDVEKIKILKTTKIQDGIVRIVFTAGKAATEADSHVQNIVDEACKLLGVTPEQLPARADELFTAWKKADKFVGKLTSPDYVARIKSGEIPKPDLELKSTQIMQGDPLQETAKLLKTQKEHVLKTLKRFLSELEESKKQIAEKLG